MASAEDKINKECLNWLWLMTLIDFGGKHLCHDVLFKHEKLPTDGTQLFKILEPLKSKMQYMQQQKILCPSTGTTDCGEFDLTLFTSVIEKLFKEKYESLVKDLRDARNIESHRGNKSLSDNEFRLLWYETTLMLHKHGLELKLVVDLEMCNPLSHQQFKQIASNILGNTDGFLLL